MYKVHTSSHEITNKPYVTSNYENTTKSVTADLTKTMMFMTNTSHDETEFKKFSEDSEHTFEGGAFEGSSPPKSCFKFCYVEPQCSL